MWLRVGRGVGVAEGIGWRGVGVAEGRVAGGGCG